MGIYAHTPFELSVFDKRFEDRIYEQRGECVCVCVCLVCMWITVSVPALSLSVFVRGLSVCAF